MIYKYLPFLFLALCLIGCKDDPSVMENIDDYIAEQGLNVTTTASGLRYEILEEGEGELPVANSILSITLKGSLTNGDVFGEAMDPFDTYITDKILGLSEGLRLMRKNSKAIFVIPPSLAFGSSGTGDVPGNSVVVYEIEVHEIDNSIQDEILQYIADSTLTAVETIDGLFHVIHEPGSANKPSINSIVEVGYVGRLTNGTVFDQNDLIRFNLSNVIRGWQLGIPLVGRAGAITLIIPPQLGYGGQGQGPIPGNAVLVFDVDLLNF